MFTGLFYYKCDIQNFGDYSGRLVVILKIGEVCWDWNLMWTESSQKSLKWPVEMHKCLKMTSGNA